ncbi:MAG: helix-turn-helix domain-containing protein [Chitinispirillales bacterium]|jgi:transcriptional regulator with XRE-family HTH domain|nr:helix-turn-helix domain-containing protein [Chitinispirillales bacterium]
MFINERIKLLRKSLKLTQVEFGSRIGITQGHLTGIEQGKKAITKSTVKVISSVFGVHEDWLRTGFGDTFKEANWAKVYSAVSVFNKLGPHYQNYILHQIEDILTVQKKRNS